MVCAAGKRSLECSGLPAPTQPTRPSLPRTADGFEIESELGRGGMGVVYLARELASGRRLALKVLSIGLSESREAFERFQREAVLAAAISDSRCVFVYGAHQFEGSPAIAMELVRGETLDHVIKKGEPVPVQQAVRWTIELLEGLEAAHRAGVLHRDVKPSNCFVTEDGHVKIGDFGLSRSLESDVQLTQSGAFLGSPLYAAPEQIKGRAVDERSDLYSAAATLYALLAGKAPWSGTNIGEVLARILSEPVEPLRKLRPGLSFSLDRVVQRAMSKDPDDRFPTLAAFREALHPFSVEPEPAALSRRLFAYLVDGLAYGMLQVGVTQVLSLISPELTNIDPQSGTFTNPTLVLALYPIAFVYFLLFEGLWGSTPGKWLLGMRVVSNATGERSFARAALRGLVWQAPIWLGLQLGLGEKFAPGGLRFTGIASLVPILLHLSYFVTAQKRRGRRALHDLASGMRVTQSPLPFPIHRRATRSVTRELVEATGAPATIGPYRVRGLVAQTAAVRVLEAEDATLSRRIWLVCGESTGPDLGAARLRAARSGRLHWLGSLVQDETGYEVFESPGGDTLVRWAAAQSALDWPTTLRTLMELAEELDRTRADGSQQTFSIDQVWIDRWGNVRLLDMPLDAQAAPPCGDPELLERAARLLMAPDGVLPRSLPGSAEPALRRVLRLDPPFASIAEARAELAALAQGTPEVTRKQRLLQTATSGGFLGLSLSIAISVGLVLSLFSDMRTRVRLYLDDLQDGRSLLTQETLDAEDIHARELLVRRLAMVPGMDELVNELDPPQRANLLRLRALTDPLVMEETTRAQERLETKHANPPSVIDDLFRDGQSKPRKSVDGFVLGWMVLIVLGALLTRGGLSLRMFGLLARDARGRRAGRLRCALRSLVAWSPLIIVLLPHAVPAINGVLSWLCIPLAALLLVLGGIYALWRPERGLPDLVAGTWLVPR